MQQNVTDLTSEQQQAIDLYLAGKSTGNIAKELGIHRQTLWRWQQIPAFQQAYREVLSAHHEEIRDLTRETIQLAIEALREEMLALKKSTHNRVDRAGTVLRLLRNEPLLKDGYREPPLIDNLVAAINLQCKEMNWKDENNKPLRV